ncbi:MAG: hypothetical protein L0219_12680, partial [Phycisphaerales bacterium]|nr:hypothetical protein [Phycisphaerales bacterium]
MVRSLKLVMVIVSAGLLCLPVNAQDPGTPGSPGTPGTGKGEGQSRERGQAGRQRGEGGGRERGPASIAGGRRLSPERATAAWEVEARSVAKGLGLDDAQT